MDLDQPGQSLITERAARVVSSRKLLRRTGRERSSAFLADGPQAVREALALHTRERRAGRAGIVTDLFVDADLADRHTELVAAADAQHIGISWCTRAAVDSLSDAVTPQGIVARCRTLDVPLAQLLGGARPRLLALAVDIRDPGNLGTLVRCADAAGADAVVVLGDSVDFYNPKAVRASAGSLFHLPVARATDVDAALRAVRAAGLRLLATEGEAQRDLDDLIDSGALGEPVAWMFGNEARGLPDSVAALADERIRIPIYGAAESLNLATAAVICLYASARAHRHA